LVDCGEGTRQRLLEAGISPLKLRAVFLSHIHGDHLFGLVPLIASLGLAGKKTPLKIFGPAAIGRLLDFYQKEFGQPVDFELEFTAVDTTKHLKIFENRTVEVWSVPLRHRTPTTGYLFIERYGNPPSQEEAKRMESASPSEDAATAASLATIGTPGANLDTLNRSYAYLSDTSPSPKAAGLVRGVDMMYHEATFAHTERTMARNTGHSTAAEAARIALKAEAGELMLGHFSSRYKDPGLLEAEARAVFPNTRATRELTTYSVPPKKSPRPDRADTSDRPDHAPSHVPHR
jgi:ribonuclease Z